MASSLVKSLDDDGVPGLRTARLEWTHTQGLPSGPGFSHDRGPTSGTLAGLARDLSPRADVPAWFPTVLRALARVSDGAAPLGRGSDLDQRLANARRIVAELAALTAQVQRIFAKGEWRVIRAPGSDTVRVRVVKETARTCLVELAEPAGGLAVGATLTLRRTKADAASEADGFVYDAR